MIGFYYSFMLWFVCLRLLRDIWEKLARIGAGLGVFMGEEEVSEEFAEELKEVLRDMEEGDKVSAEEVLN